MTNWDEVRKKITDLENNPLADKETLKTLDTISIADYWRRRFEEEKALWERRLGAREEEVRQLQERVEHLRMEMKMVQQEADSAKTQVKDREQFWVEKNKALELENHAIKERMDWEVKLKVLEGQNKLLHESSYRQAFHRQAEEEVDREKWEEIRAARQKADEKVKELEGLLQKLNEERDKWKDGGAVAKNLSRQLQVVKAENTVLEKETTGFHSQKEELLGKVHSLETWLKNVEEHFLAREEDQFEALENLARGFAHRVRNCLGILSGTLQLALANHVMEPELQEQIRLADVNAQEIMKCIEEFLSLARVPKMTITRCDVNAFLDQVLLDQKDDLKRINVKVDRHWDQKMPLIRVDETLLGQSFQAVIVNAMEAMPKGGRLEISTEVVPEKKAVRIRFHDTGSGIRESHLKKVFQPYFTTKRGHKGLGLSVCQRVVALHGGRVKLESSVGEGTTVFLTIPLPREEEK